MLLFIIRNELPQVAGTNTVCSSPEEKTLLQSAFNWCRRQKQKLWKHITNETTQIIREEINRRRKNTGELQVSSVAQSCPTLCDPMNCSMPGLPVHHQLPEFTQIHVHWVRDAIQPSHPRSSPSPPAPNPSQHQGLFQWVNSSQEVAKVLEFQLQHQSFQWTPRTDLL